MRVGSSLRYGVNKAGIVAPGDTVQSVIAEASAGTVSGATVVDTYVMARVTGVTVGQTVALKFTWQTTQGDTDSRTLYLVVVA